METNDPSANTRFDKQWIAGLVSGLIFGYIPFIVAGAISERLQFGIGVRFILLLTISALVLLIAQIYKSKLPMFVRGFRLPFIAVVFIGLFGLLVLAI